jgi:hypothetical protein
MKLIVFNKTTQSHRNVEPAVRFTKSGSIYLNKKAMELMELQAGNAVSLGQDSDRKKDWFLFRDADGMLVRKGNKGGESFIISNATAVIEVKQSLGVDAKKNFSVKLAPKPIEEKGKQYFALLTSQISK